MAFKVILKGAIGCSITALMIATAGAQELAEPAAAGAATTPKAITKPKSGTMDDFVETIGTKTGFYAAWHNSNPATFQTTLFFQAFKPTGAAVGKPVKFDGPAFIEGLPEFVTLGADFGLLWKSNSGGTKLMAAVVDAKKGKLGKPVTVLAAGAASFMHDMAPLPKGKVALVTRSFATGGEDTVLIILDKKMKPIGQPKVIEDDVSGPFGAATYEQTVVANGAGGVAIFRAADNQVKGVPFTAAGKTSAAFQINTTTLSTLDLLGLARFAVKAEPTANGGYVVVWSQLDTGSSLNFDLRARVFDAKGKPVGADFLVNQDLSGTQTAPEILSFKNGFAIAWTDVSVLGLTTQVMRFFSPTGQPISGEIVTEHFGVDGASGILVPSTDTEYARLKDGSSVKLFAANSRIQADGIPEPTIGGASGETLNGGSGDDLIIAAGGNDTVMAGAGDDVIDGGDGNDEIDGGPGANLIIPGPGDDKITAGPDGEIFVFSPGQGSDEITGFGADDRIDVSAFHYGQKANVLADAVQVGNDVVITLNGDAAPAEAVTTVRLKNTFKSALTSANIIL